MFGSVDLILVALVALAAFQVGRVWEISVEHRRKMRELKGKR